jgi:hypothetical protein
MREGSGTFREPCKAGLQLSILDRPVKEPMATPYFKMSLFASACMLASVSTFTAVIPASAQNSPAPAAAQPDKSAQPVTPPVVAPATDAGQQPKPADASKTTEPAPTITSIDVKPGDRWVYKIYEDISGNLESTATQTLTEVQNNNFNVQYTSTRADTQRTTNPFLLVFDNNWNLIQDGDWSYRPSEPYVGIKLPLKVGEQWNVTFQRTRHKPEVHQTFNETSKVVAWEHVKVRDGDDYDAYRIETTAQGKTIGNPKKFDVTGTFWYAPSVNRYVKRITETRVDGRLTTRYLQYLVAFTRRADE